MRNANIVVSFLCFLVAYFAISCKQQDSGNSTIAATAPDLKHVSVSLPKEEGYETYITNCTICHSAAYVRDQPDLPEKTWTAIVTKMRNTFGAPVSDSSAKVIIQYLTTIKGANEQSFPKVIAP